MPKTRNFRELEAQVRARPGADQRLAKLREKTLAEHGLTALRLSAGLSQQALADRIEVSQPRLSQLERSDDIQLSTLRTYLAGLGAEMEITAVFPDGGRALVEIGGSADHE